MICNMCDSVQCRYLGDLHPYGDMDWKFPIYSCTDCGCRFTVRNPVVGYYDMLHSNTDSSYGYHYDMAVKVEGFLRQGWVNRCESYLRRASYKYRELIDCLKKKERPLSILEIGCSTGFMTAFLRRMGHDVEGIDISEPAIRYAASKFGNFYSLKPTRKEYDVIFHLGLIGCVENPRHFLSECVGFLKPEGEMIFNAPNVSSPEQLNELWVSTPPPDLIHLFSERSFQTLRQYGYTVKIKKITTGSEVFYKNLLTVLRRSYTQFPQSFHGPPRKRCRRGIQGLKSALKVRLISLGGFVSHLSILKQYENEYGLFVTISQKRNG